MPHTQPKEIVIFVIGPSGAGCSTFINFAASEDSLVDPFRVPVGLPGCLSSVTKRVTRVQCTHPTREDVPKIILVDVPALDSGPEPEIAILGIKAWLSKNWPSEHVECAVLYLHRITDLRMADSPEKQLKVFKKLFPHHPPQVAVLVTTMWNELRVTQGAEERHYDIMNSFPGTFGLKVPRFDRKTESAWAAIDLVLERLETARINHGDSVVVLMGPTGSGKTSFINVALGLNVDKKSQTLSSCTNEIRTFRWSRKESGKSDIIFVDTPGFDSSELNNTEILTMLADYLNDLYRNGHPLKGILYFHRITDNRMSSNAVTNLRLFEGLCGQSSARNVCLVSTMWDSFDEPRKTDGSEVVAERSGATGPSRSIGELHERQLLSDYWEHTFDKNASYSRFLGTPESAGTIVDDQLNDRSLDAIRLQEEMVKLRMPLNETQAGILLHESLRNLIAQKQEALRKLKLRLFTLDKGTDEYIDAFSESWRLQREVEEMLQQVKKLKVKISLGKRLLSHISTKSATSGLRYFADHLLSTQRLHRKPSAPELSAEWVDAQSVESRRPMYTLPEIQSVIGLPFLEG